MSDSPVIAFLNKLTDLVLLNVLWLICSIPVITIGASTTAMYYVSITSIRSGDGYVVRRFFKSFKESFRQITPIWLVMVVCGVLFIGDLIFWNQVEGPIGKIMLVVSAVIIMMLVVIGIWVFPVFAKFTGTRRNLLKNSAAFAVGYLPYTVIILVITAVTVYVNLVSVVANSIMLFIGFALLSYIQSFFFYKVFMNHIDEKYDDFDHFAEEDEFNR